MPQLKHHWPLPLLLLLAAVSFFLHLGDRPLYYDEAIYAEVARLAAEGHWLTLQWNGVPWFEKPPLFIWSTALVFKFFGVSELAARAISGLAGVGVIGVVYLIGARLYGRLAGSVAAIVLLTSPLFLFFSRFGTTDLLLVWFLMLGIYFFLLTDENPRLWIAVGLAFGLALLVKGTAATVGPLTILASLVAERRLLYVFKSRSFWCGVLCSIILGLSWHIYEIVLHGNEFLSVYLGLHVLRRTQTGAVFGGHQSYGYYLRVLWNGFMPWIVLSPWAIYARRKSALVAAVAIPFMTYSLVQTKFPWYILPVIPPLALMIAGLLSSKRVLLGAACVLALVGLMQSRRAIWALPPEIPASARLAKVASFDGGDLITVPEELQDTVIFYSGRKVCTVPILNPLSFGYIKPCEEQAQHIIFAGEKREEIEQRFTIRVVAEDQGIFYARILR